MTWTDRYLAIPYLDGGRTWAGADCLGLYALILTHEAAASFPEFRESVGRNAAAALAAIENEILSVHRWQRVYGESKVVAERFDCVRMTGHARGDDGVVRRSDIHLGCAIGNGKMIHVEDRRGPRIIALDDPAVVRRVVGVYRPLFLKQVKAA